MVFALYKNYTLYVIHIKSYKRIKKYVRTVSFCETLNRKRVVYFAGYIIEGCKKWSTWREFSSQKRAHRAYIDDDFLSYFNFFPPHVAAPSECKEFIWEFQYIHITAVMD